MINTIHGPMNAADLLKKEGTDHGEGGRADWIEYYFKGEQVHRSVHVTITGVSTKNDIQDL